MGEESVIVLETSWIARITYGIMPASVSKTQSNYATLRAQIFKPQIWVLCFIW
jgi:hypothetical protein